MRIVVHGQQAFGKAVLEALLKRGENVIGVYVAPEKPGAKADPLKEAALAAGLPVHQPASYKDPKVWEEFKAMKPDLQVMAFVTLFVPEDFLNIPTHGSIQYHPSLLPAYRGASAINWPIIKGEKETGLSIFWPDNGLDTGDILIQKKTPISDIDTLGTVYFDRLFPMGVKAMLEAADLVVANKHKEVVQDEAQASYEGWCRKAEARINWANPVEFVYNIIRGCNPAPGAWTTLEGKELQVFDARKHLVRTFGAVRGKIGEVVEVTQQSFQVTAQGGRIEVLRAKLGDGKKVAAAELLSSGQIKAGAILGN
jgi:methionyl-tRNA formyltransferase